MIEIILDGLSHYFMPLILCGISDAITIYMVIEYKIYNKVPSLFDEVELIEFIAWTCFFVWFLILIYFNIMAFYIAYYGLLASMG